MLPSRQKPCPTIAWLWKWERNITIRKLTPEARKCRTDPTLADSVVNLENEKALMGKYAILISKQNMTGSHYIALDRKV